MTDPSGSTEEVNRGASDAQHRGGDWPIEDGTEDRLGRLGFAEAFAEEILVAPERGGFVIGLNGDWGSGKTSILNLAINAIGDRAHVTVFNPWLFSGTEALVLSFFAEIGAQVGSEGGKLKKLASQLASYGQLLAPVTAPVGAAGIVQVASEVVANATRAPSVYEQRAQISKRLAKLDKPLVVVIDDVDRLRPDEVKDIVRLVRLVGDFPNTVYVLAFDRGRVEQILGDDDAERGRAYLEKIVQVTHDVPVPRDPDVANLILKGLDGVIEGRVVGPLDPEVWANVFTFIVRPLVVTPRHARRYLEGIRFTLETVGDEVALADVLGLEAVRLMRPDVFVTLIEAADQLGYLEAAMPSYQGSGQSGPTPLDKSLAIDRQLTESISKFLFPASQRFWSNIHYGAEFALQWRLDRQVADTSVFRIYLERRLPDDVLPARFVEEVISKMNDADEIQLTVADLESPMLLDLISRISDAASKIPFDLEANFNDDPASSGLPVLLDQYERLPARGPGFFDFGPAIQVGRLTYRMLNRIEDVAYRASVAKAAFGRSKTLSAKHVITRIVGHRPNVGSGFLEAADATAMEDELRLAIQDADLEQLAKEPDLLLLAEILTETDEGRQTLAAGVEDDAFAAALLRVTTHDVTSRAIGSAATSNTKAMMWDELIKLFGDETVLGRRVAGLITRLANGWELPIRETEAIEIAGRYATGWRPNSFMDRLAASAQHVDAEDLGLQ